MKLAVTALVAVYATTRKALATVSMDTTAPSASSKLFSVKINAYSVATARVHYTQTKQLITAIVAAIEAWIYTHCIFVN